MKLFDGLAKIIGEAVVAPLTLPTKISDAAAEAINEVLEGEQE